MLQVLGSSWALLLGILLLMIGNGLQGTLLGIRGEIEGFSTWEISIVMSAYFVGFLIASRVTPDMLRRVGHVRVFAALGSFISAVLVLYPVVADPWAWTVLRAIIGFSFCGVYITAESWLNNSVANENRGKALSLYMLAQMVGIISAQGILSAGDPSGYILFIIPSVLVSISFAPILLSVSPAPVFETTKPLAIRKLIEISPLSCMGMFLLGGVFAAQFGMSSVWGAKAGLSIGQISVFVSVIYVGGLVLQYPIGWISDRTDRRRMILILAVLAGFGGLIGTFANGIFALWLISGFLLGGLSNPLYALCLAYANDYMEREDMPAASAGFLFINGVGAIFGPLLTGWMMDGFGTWAYFLFMAVLMFALAGYAAWRTTQRSRKGIVAETGYVAVTPSATSVAVEAATEVFLDMGDDKPEDEGPGAGDA
ncbi:MFS transporter [Frigidibacter sp. ROC022]|uniref:MFS transporter n=1 Tax=Frigidibacter sp. ROC022 TaxID=2971796 RepID=UPI00215B5F12|nr:MFS transporter [Frigidibacter sp. ROC022]MCR8723560.1 MFS transporter [Frigidibacter sp. ROC022]